MRYVLSIKLRSREILFTIERENLASRFNVDKFHQSSDYNGPKSMYFDLYKYIRLI